MKGDLGQVIIGPGATFDVTLKFPAIRCPPVFFRVCTESWYPFGRPRNNKVRDRRLERQEKRVRRQELRRAGVKARRRP